MNQLVEVKSLFQIREEHLQLLSAIEENDGEVTEELYAALQLSEADIQDKCVSYGFVVKHFEEDEFAIQRELDRLKLLKEKVIKKQESFRNTLSAAMVHFGISGISTPTLKLSFRKSEAVELVDERLIPAEFIESKVVSTISKTKIKEAIKAGKNVNGAALVSRDNLQIK